MKENREKIEEKYSFKSIDFKILSIDKYLNKILERNDDRNFQSLCILNILRKFVEHIGFKVYLGNVYDNDEEVYFNNNSISTAFKKLKSIQVYKWIDTFHSYLQVSESHYFDVGDNSERLMLKYYEYLVLIKRLFKDKYNIELLKNLSKFKLDTDKTYSDYYEKIYYKLKDNEKDKDNIEYINTRFYVNKIKPILINEEHFYEVTLSQTMNQNSKIGRIIAFTKLKLVENYSVKIAITKVKVDVLGSDIDINIIKKWHISIRNCEFVKLGKIFGISRKDYTKTLEYRALMTYMTKYQVTLLDIITINNDEYSLLKELMLSNVKTTPIFSIFDKAREIVSTNKKGANIIKYLFYLCNNQILNSQLSNEKCSILSDLYLKYGTIPFEEMPYATSLIYHNPSIFDLLEVFSPEDREHELLARYIRTNAENYNKMYTKTSELEGFKNLDELIEKYNSKLYFKHRPRRELIKEYDYVYIKQYEEDTINIINILNELTKNEIRGYKASFNSYLVENQITIDCDEKKEILENLYENSRVALIYGAAGTGKTTLIKYISEFFEDYKKISIANTNTAVDNLKRNLNKSNNEFHTVYSLVSKLNYNEDKAIECDLLIVDECSTISNSDMSKILSKLNYKMLILVGDIYQIESITFGNWFSIAKNIIYNKAVHELSFTWRSNDEKLKTFWNLVRNGDDRIQEAITKYEFSNDISEDMLKITSDDEVVLCLNYDGVYGINGVNYYLQNNNHGKEINIDLERYKEGDPIIFKEVKRFYPVFYNNLKGKIVKIEDSIDKVWFSVKINKVINELDIEDYDIDLIDVNESGSIVKFYVSKSKNDDEDNNDKLDNVIPFNVAYAISIHKSQGLEYDSVKLIITNEVDEMITHNIFYTAITRAKKKLKIYWSPECQNKVIGTIRHKENNLDSNIIKRKINDC